MEYLRELYEFMDFAFEAIGRVFTSPLFTIGKNPISLGTILYILVAFYALVFLSKKVKKLVVKTIHNRTDIEKGIGESIATITRFSIVIIGTIIIVQSAGINLSALSLLAGALGVGIGFGLQKITNDFVSGLIILFENPIRVGDRIEVGELSGDVVSVNARATTILTNDNISIIVPNSEFIVNRVINWSHNDRKVRFRIPVGVSYDEDPQQVKSLLMEVAEERESVMKSPEPLVLFEGFGESSLDFRLCVWTETYIDKPKIFYSELYYAIFEKFKQNGVSIPYPQRDIHLKTHQPVENGEITLPSQ